MLLYVVSPYSHYYYVLTVTTYFRHSQCSSRLFTIIIELSHNFLWGISQIFYFDKAGLVQERFCIKTLMTMDITFFSLTFLISQFLKLCSILTARHYQIQVNFLSVWRFLVKSIYFCSTALKTRQPKLPKHSSRNFLPNVEISVC